MDNMKKNETFRYLFFGVLSVAVNLFSYKILSLAIGDIPANTLAFIITIFFAYWTNSRFVFNVPAGWKSFIEFTVMRLIALPLDDGGMWLLLNVGINDLIAKIVINALVIAFNYLISKLIVFRKQKK